LGEGFFSSDSPLSSVAASDFLTSGSSESFFSGSSAMRLCLAGGVVASSSTSSLFSGAALPELIDEMYEICSGLNLSFYNWSIMPLSKLEVCAATTGSSLESSI